MVFDQAILVLCGKGTAWVLLAVVLGLNLGLVYLLVQLTHTTLVSIAHRPSVGEFNQRRIRVLPRDAASARLITGRA